MAAKSWKIQTPRFRCPHCGKTIWMTNKGRWAIHRMTGELEKMPDNQRVLHSGMLKPTVRISSVTPQSNPLCPLKPEGDG